MFGKKEALDGERIDMDYSSMSILELKAEIVKIEKLIELKTKETESQLLNEFREKCSVNGIDFDSLVVSARKPVKKKSQVKYKNSQNPSETWSGRGKKPTWLNDYLNNGGKIEDLAV